MRPTDENQAASTRPNLMSSRRTAGEENILAMLERDSARRAGGRISSPRLAWYCAAAAFSGILVGVVAWLAYDNHTTATALQAEAEHASAVTAVPPTPPEAGPPEPLPLQVAEAPHAAVIVDQPQDKPASPPPLVMLPPEEAGAPKPAAPVNDAPPAQKSGAPDTPQSAPTAAAEPVAPPAPTPKAAPADARKKAPKEDKTGKAEKPAKSPKADKPEKAAASAKADKTEKSGKADKAQRSAPRAAKAPAQRTAVADKVQARNRKGAQGAASETTVDSDVALISAIIAQSERHRGEREQAAPCSGAKCPAPPSRP